MYAAAADIGPTPEVVDSERRKQAAGDLEFFLQTYFPNSTGLSAFSDDHRRVIGRLQKCILHGGRYINAVYRGFAKTSISANAAIWAVAFGYRRFVGIFSATDKKAQEIINSIKLELSTNELLYQDFPELCHGFRMLEGNPQRAHHQKSPWNYVCPTCGGSGELMFVRWRCGTCEGAGKFTNLRQTHIVYSAGMVAIPTVQDSIASGAVLASYGITSSDTRGLLAATADGSRPRPDFCIIDDPQTAESARSRSQVKARLDIIQRDILKLAGHRKSMACVVNATIIAEDDVVSQLLDPKRNSSWLGERIPMVKQFADEHETLWLGTKDGFQGECYAAIRSNFDRSSAEDQQRAAAEANEFYLANRNSMDGGCQVSWDSCFDADCELSAIQHAYNSLIDDGPSVFSTECQNESPREAGAELRLSATDIITRLSGFERFQFPRSVEHITTFIDVQGSLLYYVVAAWCQDFTGFVIDYGSFPDQRRRYFTLADSQRTLQVEYPEDPIETQWTKGLTALAAKLCGRAWDRLDGTTLRIGKAVIDANYGDSTKAVKRFCLTSSHSAILQASHGKGIKAGDSPMGLWPVQDGEKRGHHWMLRPDKEAKGMRHLLIDTNYWKSFVHARLRMAPSSRGSLSLWGNPDRDEDRRTHEMLADHLTAEYPTHTKGRNRELDEWKEKPGKPDNHLFDCLVGCAVGASMLGAMIVSEEAVVAKPKMKLSEIYAAKHGGRQR